MKFLEQGGFLIAFVIVVVVLFLGTLNFFNIISLSQLYSNRFGLPQKAPQLNTIFSSSNFNCPLDKIYCKNAEQVTVPKAIPPFYGLGYSNIPAGTQILAIIPGKYTSGVSVGKDGQKSDLLVIVNGEMGLEADYSFKGNPYVPLAPGRGNVNQGDIIGYASGESLSQALYGKSYNLIVSLQDTKTKQFIKLKVSTDGTALVK